MKKIAAALLTVLASGIAGCSDAPTTAPDSPARTASARGGLLSTLTRSISLSTVLRRSTPLNGDVTARAIIGSEGGVIAIPEAGLRVVVPQGAVTAPVAFTATAVHGRAVAYEFEPHGMRFAKPLQVTQDLNGTDWIGLPLLNLRGAYFADSKTLDTDNAVVQVNELLPLSLDLLRLEARFDVQHFSGYVISTGRK